MGVSLAAGSWPRRSTGQGRSRAARRAPTPGPRTARPSRDRSQITPRMMATPYDRLSAAWRHPDSGQGARRGGAPTWRWLGTQGTVLIRAEEFAYGDPPRTRRRPLQLQPKVRIKRRARGGRRRTRPGP